MNKQKELYTAPAAEALVVRFEEGILQTSGQMKAKSWTSGNSSWWDDDDE